MSGTLLFNRSQEAVPILVAALKRENDVQACIYEIISLGSFGKSAAAAGDAIEPFLNNPDPRAARSPLGRS